uniref:Uncharacterized protein n=1 Tax=Mus spicilegus TaxID=10103 RepID=A0A8C6IH06_MUSSI
MCVRVCVCVFLVLFLSIELWLVCFLCLFGFFPILLTRLLSLSLSCRSQQLEYFLYIHFKCYPESSLYPPSTLLPYPPIPTSWPWCSPVLGHIKFASPMGLSSQ